MVSTAHGYMHLRALALRLLLTGVVLLPAVEATAEGFRLATFSADITIPLGHRCMGVLPTKSRSIADPLYAHGLVLLGPDPPIVLLALDWCEARNGAYDQWRDALADAAGTVRQRVLVCALHQHDAPVVDLDAASLLESVGLADELYDVAFHNQTVARVASALRDSLAESQPMTHLGLGAARVSQVASSRRVELADGQVVFHRGSRSGGDQIFAEAPEGEIDPFLRTLSFWNGDRPLAAIHSYATHPMSFYGRGEVSSDFVGLAREKRQRDDFSVKQIYVSGCSGDVTAGKYNDGAPENREVLRDRVYDAMVRAWQQTKLLPLTTIRFRSEQLRLQYSELPELRAATLRSILSDAAQRVEDRIHAAMSLASRLRVERAQPIDFPCIDFGAAKIVLFPGETFVGYQLLASEIAGDTFLLPIGYGECWPGYVPTRRAVDEGFEDRWMWVGKDAPEQLEGALRRLLQPFE